MNRLMDFNYRVPMSMLADKLLRQHNVSELRFSAEDVRAFMEQRGDCTFEMEVTTGGEFVIRRLPLPQIIGEEKK